MSPSISMPSLPAAPPPPPIFSQPQGQKPGRKTLTPTFLGVNTTPTQATTTAGTKTLLGA